MASQTPSDWFISGFLNDYALAWRPDNLIGNKVFPIIPVARSNGTLPSFPRDQWLRVQDGKRNPGEKAKAFTLTASGVNYACQPYGYASNLTYETLASADLLTMGQTQVDFVLDVLGLGQEVRVYSLVATGCGCGQVLSGATAWTASTSSFPGSNFAFARSVIRATTGKEANAMICPVATFELLNNHPDITRHALGSSAGKQGAIERLAGVAGVDTILIPDVIINAGQENQAPSYSQLWSSSVILYVRGSTNVLNASFGYNYRQVNDRIGSSGYDVKHILDSEMGVARVQIHYAGAETIVDPALRYKIDCGL